MKTPSAKGKGRGVGSGTLEEGIQIRAHNIMREFINSVAASHQAGELATFMHSTGRCPGVGPRLEYPHGVVFPSSP